jgi:undecaprenyl phosphate N,N'-diacetylbacillosamine 1-phosphate transferase
MLAKNSNISSYLLFRYQFDFFVALFILVLASPIMLISALLVALDGGPIFFRQTRVGTFGKSFKVFKFRSMIVNADDYLDERGLVTRERITKVGKFLRKSSIDELPQLFNILAGDMAIVGPRPILPRMLPFMTKQEKKRFNARPGITGLAQINGRNHAKWSKRFEMDVKYIDTASLFVDLLIVLKTVKMIITAADVSDDRNSDQVDDVTNRSLGT